MLRKLTFCTVCLLGALCGMADEANTIRVVHGRGRNAEYRLAVYEALVQAMSQVQGVSLQDSRDTSLDSFRKSLTTDGTNVSIDEIKQSLKQSVSAQTHGRVLSYDLTVEEFDKEIGMWCVEVDAKVPGQYVIGRNPNNLRRMVVMPFRAVGKEAQVMGEAMNPSRGCEEIAAKLNESLTQTRKFTMLDRAFNGETMAELGRLDLENASAGDFGRFRQLLATDYMVIGTMKVFGQPGVVENPYTGGARMSDGPFLEISYRVLLVPTSQLKWANSVTIPYSMAPGASVDAMVSSATAAASDMICEEIIANIYPLRVTAKTTFELVLNQGGKNIRPGDVFEVYDIAEDVQDVTTGEGLGGAEEMIARVQVTRVAPKMSYAVVVEGTPIGDIPVGAIVRRPQMVPSRMVLPPQQQAPKSIVHPNGGVRPPWNK